MKNILNFTKQTVNLMDRNTGKIVATFPPYGLVAVVRIETKTEETTIDFPGGKFVRMISGVVENIPEDLLKDEDNVFMVTSTVMAFARNSKNMRGRLCMPVRITTRPLDSLDSVVNCYDIFINN